MRELMSQQEIDADRPGERETWWPSTAAQREAVRQVMSSYIGGVGRQLGKWKGTCRCVN
jgi:hypothetical protein